MRDFVFWAPGRITPYEVTSPPWHLPSTHCWFDHANGRVGDPSHESILSAQHVGDDGGATIVVSTVDRSWCPSKKNHQLHAARLLADQIIPDGVDRAAADQVLEFARKGDSWAEASVELDGRSLPALVAVAPDGGWMVTLTAGNQIVIACGAGVSPAGLEFSRVSDWTAYGLDFDQAQTARAMTANAHRRPKRRPHNDLAR